MSAFYSIVHKISFWIILAFVSSFVIRLILLLDPNKRVYNHTPGPCRILTEAYKGIAGMHLVESQSRVYITFGYAKAFGVKAKPGIAYYEVKKADNTNQNPQHTYELVAMTIEWKDGFDSKYFAPAGIASYVSKGRVLLYVVNAHPNYQCIHFFSVDKNALKHRKTVCDAEFTSIQDVAVVGADRLFITNLAYFSHGYLQVAELAAQSNTGKVLLYDGHNVKVAVSSLPSPSGIAYDKERQLLFVGSMLNEMIKVYDVGKDISLNPKTDISILTSPMGIHVDKKSGDIWVSCHPVAFQAFLHYQHPDEENMRSPSQVLRIRMQEDGVSWVITEPYANDGATVSASKSIAYYEEQLLIGGAFGRLLHCDVLNPQIT
ncbi:unnamed protein product [Caenorhabditis bovis]|uniref:Arylesterase n=1 Tax=Caenorhabditis bovis TaxID=2654633 RepID=A0A8S1F8S8_9PELO|nr:unnamed protein product [Caenorhabditis bovis]